MMKKIINLIANGDNAAEYERYIGNIFENEDLELSYRLLLPSEYLSREAPALPAADLTVVFNCDLPSALIKRYSAQLDFYNTDSHAVIVSDPVSDKLFTESGSVYGTEGKQISDTVVYSELGIEKVLRTALEFAEVTCLPVAFSAARNGYTFDHTFNFIAATVAGEYEKVISKNVDLPTCPFNGVLCCLRNNAYFINKLVYAPAFGETYARLLTSRYGDNLLNIRSYDQKPDRVCRFLKKIIFDL